MRSLPAVPSRRSGRIAVTAFVALSLTAALGGCGPEDTGVPAGAPTAAESTDGKPGNSTTGAVPEGLVGEWQDPADLSLGQRSLDLYDPGSGWVADPNDARAGSGIRITSDGGYVWSTYAAVSNGGCWSHGITYQRGSAQGDGDTIVLEPEVNRRTYQGGCNSASDMDREESHSPQRWSWKRTTDQEGRTHLTLVSVEATHDYVLVAAS
ncbi:hypothetical protein [Streptomyces sp. GC420]|uniref:hypothetical protein n=1 Tax=Streptomyces sp. GC420 TaxID=2697568 RepID=UPI00141526E0|nr:hypothetical protein [Streptomyces sp. GC420]NBM19665.1 hypothetical protein [Streptomyces sp. GC420]